MSDSESISGVNIEDLKFSKEQSNELLKANMVNWINSHDTTTVSELSAVTGVTHWVINQWLKEEGYYTLTTVHKF